MTLAAISAAADSAPSKKPNGIYAQMPCACIFLLTVMHVRLAEYIESEPLRKKAQQEAQKAKLEALEKKLGIDGTNGAGPSETVAGKKRRLDDSEYVEQSKELVDNVKSAVAAGELIICCTSTEPMLMILLGFLKKKKKAKTSPPPAANDSATSVAKAVATAASTVAETASEVSEKVLSAPETAPVAIAVAAAAGIATT
jgi:hypothetical protein